MEEPPLECLKMSKLKVIKEGYKNNRLTALSFSHSLFRVYVRKRKGRVYNENIKIDIWNFKCDCGKEKQIDYKSVIYGNSKSCGCINIEQCREKQKGFTIKKKENADYVKSGFKRAYHAYLTSAKKRGYNFELTIDLFKIITKVRCTYCGDPPKSKSYDKSKQGYYLYNGIDRVDPKKGYILGNVVTCCKTCNYAKASLTLAEFQSWIKRLKAWNS